jgi:hypothetical protein
MLVLAGLATSGCADEQESLIVLRAPAWGSSDECVIDAGQELGLLRGVLDVSFGTPYLLGLAVQSQLVAQSSGATNSGVVTNEVQLLEADVRLSSDNAPEIIDGLEARNEAFVDFTYPLATDSVAPGEAVGVGIEVIGAGASQALAEELAAFDPSGVTSNVTVLAEVVIRGKSSGNTAGDIGIIEARSYSFPINLCFGCLFTCETCEEGICPADDPSWHGGVCNGLAQDLPIVPSSCELPN